MSRTQKPQPKPTVRWETITPAKAKTILRQAAKNRNLIESRIESLAAAINNNEWDEFNGESIKINVRGACEDGQHRLHAIIRAGVAVKVLVVRNVPVGVFKTIDVGAKRTMGHTLQAMGTKNANKLAGAGVWLWRHLNGLMNQESYRPRVQEVLDVLKKHPALKDSVLVGNRVSRGDCKIMPPSIATCLHYLFAKQNSAAAERFWSSLIEGEHLSKKQPVYQLRERLINNAASSTKLRRPTIAALVIKAWNAHQNGDTVKCLRWNKDEVFPTIRE